MESETQSTVERPKIVKQKHLKYLDSLRESGITNMFGAAPYLASSFGLSKQDARVVLAYWMKSYGERHPSGE